MLDDSDFFALVAGRLERYVDGLLEIVQVDVAVSVVQQFAQLGFELAKVWPSLRIRVPTARHQSVELGPAVAGPFQPMAVLDATHHLAGFHSRVRRRSYKIGQSDNHY